MREQLFFKYIIVFMMKKIILSVKLKKAKNGDEFKDLRIICQIEMLFSSKLNNCYNDTKALKLYCK